MVITVLQATGSRNSWRTLAKAYEEKTHVVPPAILNSYLAQDQASPEVWRIITMWKSQEDLDAMRLSGQTPTGVLIFQEAGGVPALLVLKVEKTARE